MQYRVTSMSTRKGVMYYVYDTQSDTEVYRTKIMSMAEGRAERLNTTTEASASPESTPTASPMRPGWSKAARRRAGETSQEHPLGKVVHRGAGFTEYQDTAFGGGRVQIWDES